MIRSIPEMFKIIACFFLIYFQLTHFFLSFYFFALFIVMFYDKICKLDLAPADLEQSQLFSINIIYALHVMFKRRLRKIEMISTYHEVVISFVTLFCVLRVHEEMRILIWYNPTYDRSKFSEKLSNFSCLVHTFMVVKNLTAHQPDILKKK